MLLDKVLFYEGEREPMMEIEKQRRIGLPKRGLPAEMKKSVFPNPSAFPHLRQSSR